MNAASNKPTSPENAKHTPGPSVMIYSRNGKPSHCSFEAHPHEIDDPRDCFGKKLELVASVPVQVAIAAPELLEALLHARDLLSAYGMDTPNLIRAALAKAGAVQ